MVSYQRHKLPPRDRCFSGSTLLPEFTVLQGRSATHCIMKSMTQNPPGGTVNPRDSRAAESCTYQVMGGTDMHNTDPKAIFKAENVTGGRE